MGDAVVGDLCATSDLYIDFPSAEQLAFWDSPIVGAPSAGRLMHLGHQAEIAHWLIQGELEQIYPHSRLRNIGGWEVEYLPE